MNKLWLASCLVSCIAKHAFASVNQADNDRLALKNGDVDSQIAEENGLFRMRRQQLRADAKRQAQVARARRDAHAAKLRQIKSVARQNDRMHDELFHCDLKNQLDEFKRAAHQATQQSTETQRMLERTQMRKEQLKERATREAAAEQLSAQAAREEEKFFASSLKTGTAAQRRNNQELNGLFHAGQQHANEPRPGGL